MNRQKEKVKALFKGDRLFDVCVTALLLLIAVSVLYPLIFVVSASISDPNAVNSGEMWLLPKGIHFDGYKAVFKNKWILIGYRNSIAYTIIGTVLNVVTTVMAGYALSRKDLPGRSFFNWYIAVPMWFGGGLIPTYLVMSKIGLVNNPLILILLGMVSSYNLIICRTFMSGLPFELQEAARIDGANDFQVFRCIILPVCMPILAVLSLYYAVGHWNSYFSPMIYLNDKNVQPLQVMLREILLLNQNINPNELMDTEALVENMRIAGVMKYALIIVASAPLLILYPMLQKYFVKGVLIGAVKG